MAKIVLRCVTNNCQTVYPTQPMLFPLKLKSRMKFIKTWALPTMILIIILSIDFSEICIFFIFFKIFMLQDIYVLLHESKWILQIRNHDKQLVAFWNLASLQNCRLREKSIPSVSVKLSIFKRMTERMIMNWTKQYNSLKMVSVQKSIKCIFCQICEGLAPATIVHQVKALRPLPLSFLTN